MTEETNKNGPDAAATEAEATAAIEGQAANEGEAAAAQERVLKDPGPSAALSAFGADGLEFTVGYWIADPENGQLNIRSAINLAILDSLRRHGIEIPYPQRVLHVKAGDGPAAAVSAPKALTGP